jgi:hypothetical protein
MELGPRDEVIIGDSGRHHRDVKPTTICTHVTRSGPLGVTSPADRL